MLIVSQLHMSNVEDSESSMKISLKLHNLANEIMNNYVTIEFLFMEELK